MGITTAFWGMTLNNYDETDLVLIQTGYPDYCREIVHTLEVGKEGTPHIQAWIKLQRQQRLSFVKKLFPRGRFQPLTGDEYNEHTKRYAQKLDATAASAAVHIFNDPIPDPVTALKDVCKEVIDHYMPGLEWSNYKERDFLRYCNMVEFSFVQAKPKLAKFYVGSLYKNVKKTFWRAMCANILEDTHTHSDEKFSQSVDIPTTDGRPELLRKVVFSGDEGGAQGGPQGDQDTEGEDHEDSEGETDEGYSEGSADVTGEEDDLSQ